MLAYGIELLLQIAIYSVLAASLSVVAGRAGLVSVCHAAFFGVGAYSSAVVTARLAGSKFVGGAIGILVAIVVAAIVARLAGALRSEYFVLVSFALQTVVSGVFLNWIALTRGGMGIARVPPLSSLGSGANAMLTIGLCAMLIGVVGYISATPYGRVLAAIRDDERFAESLGKNVRQFKISAVCLTAGIAAAAGTLYAHWVGYVSPTSFDVNRSILLLSMVVLGGADRVLGAVLGAIALVLVPEIARVLVGGPLAANLQGVLYGAVLVLAVTLRPRGIWKR